MTIKLRPAEELIKGIDRLQNAGTLADPILTFASAFEAINSVAVVVSDGGGRAGTFHAVASGDDAGFFRRINIDVVTGLELDVVFSRQVRALLIYIATSRYLEVPSGIDGTAGCGITAAVDPVLDGFIADKRGVPVVIDGLLKTSAFIGFPTVAALLIGGGDDVDITPGIQLRVVTGADAAADDIDVTGRIQNRVISGVDLAANTIGTDDLAPLFV